MTKKGKKLILTSVLSTSGASPPSGGSVQSQRSKKSKGAKQGSVTSVAAPLALSRVTTNVPPTVMSIGSSGAVRITHMEYIGDLIGIQQDSGFFSMKRFTINPGIDTTFPWLWNIAQSYESYTFRSLSFEYAPSLGANTPGSIVMSVDYDVLDPAPTTKADLMACAGAVRAPLWSPAKLQCSPADLTKFSAQRYTRADFVTPDFTSDLKTYDVGVLNVIPLVPASIAGTVVGEIYARYVVDLYTPQPRPNVCLQPALITKDIRSAGGLQTPFQGATLTGDLPIKIQSATDLLFEKAGEFMVDLEMHGTGIQTSYPTTQFTAGTGNVKDSSGMTNPNGDASRSTLGIVIRNAPAIIRFAVAATTLAQTVWRIAPYPYSKL